MLRETDWERLREIAKGGGERNCGRLWRVVTDCERLRFQGDCGKLRRIVRDRL